jgi:hypothetical protein
MMDIGVKNRKRETNPAGNRAINSKNSMDSNYSY